MGHGVQDKDSAGTKGEWNQGGGGGGGGEGEGEREGGALLEYVLHGL